MPRIEEHPESSSASIVAIGSFNPLIVRPDWLGEINLISREAAKDADIQVIHHDIVEFTADGIHYHATAGRVSIGTNSAGASPVVRDHFAGVFSVLESTPIHSFGFNLDQHFKCGSKKDWPEISSGLAPSNPWGELISEPELQAVEMRGVRDTEQSPSIKIAVEPSGRVPSGICVRVNQHYDMKCFQDAPSGRLLDTIPTPSVVEIVNSEWEDFQRYASAVPLKLTEAAVSSDSSRSRR